MQGQQQTSSSCLHERKARANEPTASHEQVIPAIFCLQVSAVQRRMTGLEGSDTMQADGWCSMQYELERPTACAQRVRTGFMRSSHGLKSLRLWPDWRALIVEDGRAQWSLCFSRKMRLFLSSSWKRRCARRVVDSPAAPLADGRYEQANAWDATYLAAAQSSTREGVWNRGAACLLRYGVVRW